MINKTPDQILRQVARLNTKKDELNWVLWCLENGDLNKERIECRIGYYDSIKKELLEKYKKLYPEKCRTIELESEK